MARCSGLRQAGASRILGGELRVSGRRDVGPIRRDGARGLPRPGLLPDRDRPCPAEDRYRLAELAEVAEDRDQRLLHRIGAILQGDRAATAGPRNGINASISSPCAIRSPRWAQLTSVHRVLFAEGARRILAGQPREEICQVLAAAARRAFDLLEPSLGGYAVRA